MKTKLAILTLIGGICMTASAVTISWNGSTTTSALKGLTSGAGLSVGASSETASLVLYYFDYADYDTIIGLGKVEASDVASYAVATATGQTSTSANAAGRVKASSTNTDYTTADNSFFARAYTSFGGKSYFIDLFGGTGTDGTWTMASSGDARVSEKFSWSDGTYGGATSTSVGTKNAWVAVPEPSTAALALAGLALLLKRRKA